MPRRIAAIDRGIERATAVPSLRLERDALALFAAGTL